MLARWGSLSALILAFGFASAAQAAPVHFDFEGKCFGTEGSGCAAYGLNEGDLVSGRLTIDSAHVVGGESVQNVDQLAGSDFSFTFGNQSFDLDDLDDPFIAVTFNADATQLTCLSGSGGCPIAPSEDFVRFNNGTKQSILPNGARLQAQYNFVDIFPNKDTKSSLIANNGVGPGSATAKGPWVRDPVNQVPEPSAALLFVIGGVVVHAQRKRALKR